MPDVVGVQPGSRAVIRSDEDDPSEGSAGERLGRELGGEAASPPREAGDQSLSAKRSVAIEDRIETEPGLRLQVRRACWGGRAEGGSKVGGGARAGPRRPWPVPGTERRRGDEPDRRQSRNPRPEPTQPSCLHHVGVTSSGGWVWREEGEAGIVPDGPYRRLITA